MILYSKKVNLMALHALAGAMLSMGIDPVDESFKYKDCGPHRIYMLEGFFEPNRHQLDANIVMHKLHNYFQDLKNTFQNLNYTKSALTAASIRIWGSWF